MCCVARVELPSIYRSTYLKAWAALAAYDAIRPPLLRGL